MARLKPALWALDEAKRGERGAGEAALRQLAVALRGVPSPEVLEEAAALFERAADGGAAGAAKALYLAHDKRPKETRRKHEIGCAVDELVEQQVSLTQAYAAVARQARFQKTSRGLPAKLSIKSVEDIYLKWRTQVREAQQDTHLEYRARDTIESTPEGRAWEQMERDGRRWVEEADLEYRRTLEEYRRRQAEYSRWIEESWRPGISELLRAPADTPKK